MGALKAKAVALVPILAAEGGADFASVTTAVSNLGTVITTVMGIIYSDPVLAILFSTAVIGAAIFVVKKIKKAAKG